MGRLVGLERMNEFLFVCSQNWQRSPTCEHVARIQKCAADSAGTDLGAVRPLTPEAIARAERLVAMEEVHAKAIARMAPGRVQDIECWNIPDDYSYCADSLVSEIKRLLREPRISLIWRSGNVGRKGPSTV